MKNWRTIIGAAALKPFEYRSDIQPFAGVYPTRWVIFGKYGFGHKQDQVFQYHGKPNTCVAYKLRDILTHASCGSFTAMEFDRAGLIAHGRCLPPRQNIQVSDWTDAYRFYYPWIYADATMITNWCRVVHRVPIIFRGHRAVVYTASPTEQILHENWSLHKQWLGSANLRWVEPHSTSTNSNS